MKGVIFDIKRYAIHDGPGIRTSVFFKGCPLTCWWCHNPESRSPKPQPMQRPRADAPDQCEMVGYQATAEEVLGEVERDRLFYDESGGGVTFTGGEPLFQPAFLAALLRASRERDLHTAVDTTGFAPPAAFEAIDPHVSLYLFDLKLMDDARHLRYTGVSNRSILDNLRRLDRAGRKVWVRIPIVPGVNDDRENLEAAARLAASLETRPPVHLLPYHPAGVDKYRRLGMENPLPDLATPGDEQLAAARNLFTGHGLEVYLGN